MSSRLILAGMAGLLLAACETVETRIAPQAGSLDAGIGEATRYNAAAQIINPDPVYTAEDEQPGYHGAKAAAATRRYRTDQVKDTVPAATSNRRTTGGSGSGSSGPR